MTRSRDLPIHHDPRTAGGAGVEIFGTRPWVFLAIVVYFVIFYVAAPAWQIVLRYDTCVYLDLSDSLLAGAGYRYHGVPHTQYPPGFPFQLALFQLLDPGAAWPCVLSVKLCGLLSILLSGLLIRRFAGPNVTGLLMMLSIANWNSFHYSSLVMSEMPFAVWFMATLYFLERSVREVGGCGLLCISLAALFGTIAILYRTAGVVLIPTAVLFLLIRGSGTLRMRVLTGLVMPLAWMAVFFGWKLAVVPAMPVEDHVSGPVDVRQSEGSAFPYLDMLLVKQWRAPEDGRSSPLDLVRRCWGNVPHLAKSLAREVWSQPRWYPKSLKWPVPLLLAGGWAVSVFRYRTVWDFLTPFYAGILLIVPWDPEVRLLVPITPFVFWYGWVALEAIGAAFLWLLKRRVRWVLFALLPVAAGVLFWAAASPAWQFLPCKLFLATIMLPVGATVTALAVSPDMREKIFLSGWRLSWVLVAVLMMTLATVQMCVDQRFSILKTRQWKRHSVYLGPSCYFDAAEFLQSVAAAEARIATSQAPVFRRLTGLPCDLYPRARSGETLVRHLIEYDYVIDCGYHVDVDYLRPALRNASDRFVACSEFRGDGRVIIYCTSDSARGPGG